MNDDGGLQIKGDVRDALERGLPVVALESTIISHGTLSSPCDLLMNFDMISLQNLNAI